MHRIRLQHGPARCIGWEKPSQQHGPTPPSQHGPPTANSNPPLHDRRCASGAKAAKQEDPDHPRPMNSMNNSMSPENSTRLEQFVAVMSHVTRKQGAEAICSIITRLLRLLPFYSSKRPEVERTCCVDVGASCLEGDFRGTSRVGCNVWLFE